MLSPRLCSISVFRKYLKVLHKFCQTQSSNLLGVCDTCRQGPNRSHCRIRINDVFNLLSDNLRVRNSPISRRLVCHDVHACWMSEGVGVGIVIDDILTRTLIK